MELSKRICAKDSPDRDAALEEFINATIHHSKRVFAGMARKFGIRDVEDRFNDTYAKFFDASLRMGWEKKIINNLCKYFNGIGYNVLLEESRLGGRGDWKKIEDLPPDLISQLDPNIERFISPDPDLKDMCEKAMQELSKDDQEILNLYYGENLSHKEIAERLGINEEASRNRLSRARKRLRDNLDNLLDN